VQRRRFLGGLSAVVALAIVLTACGRHSDDQPTAVTSASATSNSPSSTASASTPTASSTPVATTDPLTGGPTSKNPVVAVKIDNTSEAFPQFGIGSADVVYVEQVEGGLTRLIGIFHTALPEEVGPVRSVRTTDVQLLPTYGGPLLVFSGGKTAILDLLHATTVIDTSQDSGYSRTEARTAPYDLVASLPEIVAQHPGKAVVQSTGMTFIPSDPRVAAAPKVAKITVTMSEGETSFSYVNGVYQVFHHGTQYEDADHTPVTADNVVVQHVVDKPDGFEDSVGSPSYLTQTVGTGTFTLYRDGHAITGTWKRDADADPTQFLDDSGKPVPFRPGKTWVLLAPQTAELTQN
jgi:hypothetical protein